MSELPALLLIDHGSRRAQANELLQRVAQMVEARLGEGRIVEVAHMELAAPDIDAAFARCVKRGAKVVVAHPFMLTPGRHATEDIPRLVAAAAATHPGVRYVVAEPLGAHEGIAEAVIDRCVTAWSEQA